MCLYRLSRIYQDTLALFVEPDNTQETNRMSEAKLLRQIIPLALAHRDYIRHEPDLYYTMIEGSLIGSISTHSRAYSIGEWLDIWEVLPFGYMQCPSCRHKGYLHWTGILHGTAHFFYFCPDCGTYFCANAFGDTRVFTQKVFAAAMEVERPYCIHPDEQIIERHYYPQLSIGLKSISELSYQLERYDASVKRFWERTLPRIIPPLNLSENEYHITVELKDIISKP